MEIDSLNNDQAKICGEYYRQRVSLLILISVVERFKTKHVLHLSTFTSLHF